MNFLECLHCISFQDLALGRSIVPANAHNHILKYHQHLAGSCQVWLFEYPYKATAKLTSTHSNNTHDIDFTVYAEFA
jgi:hypothetical protein